MNKILLIIHREYKSRVTKKSFIIMSILGPILFGALIIVPIWLATSGSDEKLVKVVDKSELFANNLPNEHNIVFEFVEKSQQDGLMDQLDENTALLYIPDLDLNNPSGIYLKSDNSYGIEFERNLRGIVQKQFEKLRMEEADISKERLDSIESWVEVMYFNGTSGEKETDSKIATAVGYVSSFAIYMFIFIYGAQVMRGVAEEKTNRIVEVIISSIKPFQLMMGKIVGIALVVLTQLGIWIVFTSAIYTGISAYYADEMKQMAETEYQSSELDQSSKFEQAQALGQVKDNLNKINIPLIIFSFVFFFLGGYLLYAALFAMVGGAVDSMEDSQQFMLPITIPLILSIVILASVIQNPHGSIAIWMSMIPLTSPVVMMMRVPFDVPTWQLLLSMSLLIAGFIFTTWFAGKIYRVGILMHGSKVTYKTLYKWFFLKN